MALDPDIRDQAYQFFIQEAPELLHVIESGLLTLAQERSTASVHNIMRAAHSIKGGAASVGLEAIKTLAHRLEDMFKALYSEALEVDPELEGLLLQGYDCLRLPLTQKIETGNFDSEQALATAEPVFAQIEAKLGDFLTNEGHLPSSVELGVDLALSIFEVDVAEGLDRLDSVVANPEANQVAGELRAQADTFAGLAELLNLPGFGAIAHAALAALDAYPSQSLHVTRVALADFRAAQQAVIGGDRTQGGAPSAALVELAEGLATGSDTGFIPTLTGEVAEVQAASLDDVFSALEALLDDESWDQAIPTPAHENLELELLDAVSEQSSELNQSDVLSLDNILDEPIMGPEVAGLADVFPQTPAPESSPEIDPTSAEPAVLSLDDLFGDFVSAPETAESDAPPQIQSAPEPLVTSSDSDSDSTLFEETAVNGQPPAAEPTSAVRYTTPSLDDVFGSAIAEIPEPGTQTSDPKARPSAQSTGQTIQEAIQSVEQVFENLPPLEAAPATAPTPDEHLDPVQSTQSQAPVASESARLSVRVALDRLERMNNQVGELSINRNGLALQNEQLQAAVQELVGHFTKFQGMASHLRDLSDQMLISPDRSSSQLNSKASPAQAPTPEAEQIFYSQANFDALEMDSYGELHLLLQATLEQMVQLEEKIDDIVVFSGQSSQTIDQQRQMLTYLRDDLMWARMLPLGEVLNRFPRMMRDLAAKYHKPVNLKLNGTGVLVDKAALEKLYDPLLHLLRNAFDHGIEPMDVRRQNGKPERGQIEIRAYHQGSQTIIEVRDDGRGLNLERIRDRAQEIGLLPSEQLATASSNRLIELMFEPGFSTASQVSELSGRGVGLDVVRSQLRSLKGNVTVTSEPARGTIFSLRIPLTLTITKLLVCLVGYSTFAFPSDSIDEILIPQPDQLKQSGTQKFLHWRQQLVPAYQLSKLIDYACLLPETVPSQALAAVPTPEEWAAPMLMLRQGEQYLALEVDRLLIEQELVIKPFGNAIAPPSYIYGCTILGDGSLIPVVDAASLLREIIDRNTTTTTAVSFADRSNAPDQEIEETKPAVAIKVTQSPTLLVVDDSIALRQTIALTLQKVGYRVLQARDGREAIEQLQQNARVQMVICDVEMPNMNGFEFLSYRRQDPQLAKVPVAMLTSRSSDKHRRLATHLGANAYFTKPYIEQEFLTAIKMMIAQGTSST